MAAALQENSGVQSGQFHAVRFENGELHMTIETTVAGRHCVILGSIAPPDQQMLAMLLLAHTLKKERARRVTAIFPYLAYARDDKDKAGQSLATAWVAALLEASGIDQIFAVDVHSERAQKLFKIPVVSLSPASICADAIRRCGLQDATIVAPDNGAIARCQAVRNAAGMPPGEVPYFEKQRTAGGIKHSRLVGKTGRRVVIVDDILDTGGTLLSACEKLTEAGVEDISIMVTHGLFSGERWKMLPQFGVKRIFCTDAVPPPSGAGSADIVWLSVVPVLRPELFALANT